MKRYLILFYILFQSLLFADGPYSVGIITEQDGLRNGPDYAGGIVYYPEGIEGPLPIIVMIPGFISPISYIDDWGPYLASYGVVTMFVNVNNWFGDPYARANALIDGIVSIKLEDTRIQSPLFSNLNTEDIAVAGWSMGGGGAQLASQQDVSIKTVIALSPWLFNAFDALNNRVPIIYFSGEFDPTAPNNSHTNLHYNNTSDDIDKLLFEISQGNHYTVCSPYNDNQMAQKALFWIEKYINENIENCNSLIAEPFTASSFLTNIECNNQLIGDLNFDLVLNVQDIILIVNIILSNQDDYLADISNDGFVNVLDVIQLVNIILN